MAKTKKAYDYKKGPQEMNINEWYRMSDELEDGTYDNILTGKVTTTVGSAAATAGIYEDKSNLGQGAGIRDSILAYQDKNKKLKEARARGEGGGSSSILGGGVL